MEQWRSHAVGGLRKEHAGQHVRLCGWIHTKREHGDLVFVLLRDREGTLQVSIQRTEENEELWATARDLRPEFCVQVEGKVHLRPPDAVNPDMKTGEVELIPTAVTILNECKLLPFPINRETDISEELALKYRYLEMRKPTLAGTIRLRHNLVLFIRNLMNDMGFIEVETPLLTRSTPEGARDFLVPSRVHPGKFFALPQSPQQYKELLMVGGIERYFQFARCLRDEDARADRQAEHTQLDFEMSFVDTDDIIGVLEKVFVSAAEQFSDLTIKEKPIPRLTYQYVMDTYGSDKPDLRFGMELVDLADAFTACELEPLKEAATRQDQTLRGMIIPNGGLWSRKELDQLKELPEKLAGTGIAWVAYKAGQIRGSSIKRILDEQTIAVLEKLASPGPDDLLLFAGGPWKPTVEFLGRVRTHMANKLDLIDRSMLALLFVVDFPQFEWNPDQNRLDPVHHMFVLPKKEHIPLLDSEPLSVLSTQMDAVCNGFELCSGSLRNHQRELQVKIMKLIGINEQEGIEKFGHLLNALEFGAPPHGGAAPGLDRLLMVLQGTERMSDVVAFPKTYSGRDLLMDAPASVDQSQLDDLHLAIVASDTRGSSDSDKGDGSTES